MTEMALPKITMRIMAVKILGAADGFLPRAPIEAYPVAAMIKHGPRIAKMNIKTTAT
jgi:hypothetical protein